MNNGELEININIKNNKQQIKNNIGQSIGFAAFFQNSDVNVILEDYILDYQSFKEYPNEIKYRRNVLIVLSMCQILASFIGMLILIVRRSFIYIFINLLAIILAFCGVYGATKIHVIFLIIHCIFTTAVTGGFFVYQILDLFLASDTTYGDKKRFGDNLLLFVFSLPYVFDCCVGVYNYITLKKITEFKSSKNRDKGLLNSSIKKKNYSNEQIDSFISTVDNKLCVICMSEARNTVLNPCGHVLSCEDCSKTIFENKRSNFFDVKCPLCKRRCDSYIKVYLS